MIALTFPGAAAVVQAVHDEMQRLYPAIPDLINIYDEPSGDFGIAHFYGYDRETAEPYDVRASFDSTYIPMRYVICHELGHAMSFAVSIARGGNGFTNGLYDEFWAVRGFPGTANDGQWEAIRLENISINGGYSYWVEENFADAFGAVNSYGQGTLITRVDAYLDEPRLRAFYKSLEGALDLLTDEDIERIARSVANRILPDVLTKLDSGFNTSITTFLDRQSLGDKKVATAEID